MRFFATKNDLLPVVTKLESEVPVQYCATGLFDSPHIICYTCLASVPNWGLAQPDNIQSPGYLILPANAGVQIRAIPQRRGGVMYAIDQLFNPETLTIRPGGIYKEGVLIEGSLGSAYKSDFAALVTRLFRKKITKDFKRIDHGCYAGREAYSLLEQGWRLVQSASQPLEYDQKVK